MKPYYEDDAVTIYHGDCREIMPTLGPVDLLLTDPPYGVAYETNWRAKGDKMRSAIANDETLDAAIEAMHVAFSILRDDRHWYAFASPAKLVEFRLGLEGAGRAVKQVLAWDKGDQGTVGDLKAGFGEAWEAVFYGMKGRREIRGARPRTMQRFDWSASRDPVHPTVKPVELLARFVGWSSDPGEVVLDPFMGSGTTLRAAKDLGRKAIGIEIEERYCEIAAERCAQMVFDFEGEG